MSAVQNTRVSPIRCHVPFQPQLLDGGKTWIKSAGAALCCHVPTRRMVKTERPGFFRNQKEVFTHGNLLYRLVFRKERQIEQREWIWVILFFSMEAIWRKERPGEEEEHTFLGLLQPMASFWLQEEDESFYLPSPTQFNLSLFKSGRRRKHFPVPMLHEQENRHLCI